MYDFISSASSSTFHPHQCVGRSVGGSQFWNSVASRLESLFYTHYKYLFTNQHLSFRCGPIRTLGFMQGTALLCPAMETLLRMPTSYLDPGLASNSSRKRLWKVETVMETPLTMPTSYLDPRFASNHFNIVQGNCAFISGWGNKTDVSNVTPARPRIFAWLKRVQ